MAFDVSLILGTKQIPTDWKITKVGNVSSVNGLTLSASNPPEVIEYIDISSVGERTMEKPKEMSYKDAPSRAKRIVSGNDFLISTVRPNLRHYVYIREQRKALIASTGFAVVSSGPDVDSRFLYYYLTCDIFTEYLTRIADGGAYPAFNPSEIRDAELLMPPLPEQRMIGHILGTIDDKIEINHRMNETLETIARTIFRSWFIDFDPVRAKAEGKQPFGMDKETAALFPSEFEDSELGEIPKGWSMERLGDHIDLDKGLSYKGQYLSDSGVPLINLGNIARFGGFNISGTKFYNGEYKQKHVVRPGELVVANTDITQNREVLGSPAIVPDLCGARDCVFTHHLYAVRTKTWLSPLMIYHVLQNPKYRERCEGYATGTTVLALPRDTLMDYRIPVPPKQIHDAFISAASKTYCLSQVNNAQSTILSALRDALLPKLLSGELRVPQAIIKPKQ